MKASEIIKQDAERHGVDPARVLSFIGERVESGQGTILQHGDSVLLLTRIGSGDAELHLYTLEQPLALMKSLKYFISTIEQTPIKRVYGQADNPGIIQMLQSIGVDVQESDRPEYNWMAVNRG
jgi:hypothetical protein